MLMIRAEDDDPDVSAAVAANENTTFDTLRILIEDKIRYVSFAARRNMYKFPDVADADITMVASIKIKKEVVLNELPPFFRIYQFYNEEC